MYVMKNFFHYGKFDLGSAYDREIGSTNLECDKIQELLKTAYDYADHLFDRRFEQIELGPQDGTEKAAKSEKQKRKRVQKLYQILEGVKDAYQSFSSSAKSSMDSNKLDILYHLTIGNICMRIEQWYLDNYHYELADRWYGMATGALWQGINKVDALDGSSEDEHISIYHLLLRLNIGKCYRNFANQNRRSDFLAAKEKFLDIKDDIEKRLEYNGKMSRELALIWADASVNIARIYRHMYKMASAEEEFSYVLASLSAIDESVIRLQEENGRVIVGVLYNQTSYHKVILDNTSADTLMSSNGTGKTGTISRILKCTTQGDRKTIILQVLIEFGMLLRKKRRYFDAVYIFMAADFYDPERNIDAINNISSALRKYITTSDVNSSDIDNLIDQIQVNVSDREYTTLADQLKQYAVRGNLYAAREFIRWHCDCYVNKNKGIKKWIGIDSVHPEKVLEQMGCGLDDIIEGYGATYDGTNNYCIDGIIERINQLIQVNYEASKSYSEKYAKENVQLLYLKGNVQLQFQCYDDAIRTLETVCLRKEANYIRRGKLGLKTRYQLAQCYMAKAEFREASEILCGIRETLKSSFKSRRNSSPSDERYSDAAPDFRVDRDYGYCLMQLGNYHKACEIYEEIETEQRYKNYNQHQQVMSLNNYASCLIHMGNIDKAEEVLIQAQTHSPNKKDKVTNLLWGYCFVCRGNRNAAQHYFDVAYGHDYDINPDIYGDAKTYAQRNKARDQNVVEQRSAYIINLTKIWEVSEESEEKRLICKKIEESPEKIV